MAIKTKEQDKKCTAREFQEKTKLEVDFCGHGEIEICNKHGCTERYCFCFKE